MAGEANRDEVQRREIECANKVKLIGLNIKPVVKACIECDGYTPLCDNETYYDGRRRERECLHLHERKAHHRLSVSEACLKCDGHYPLCKDEGLYDDGRRASVLVQNFHEYVPPQPRKDSILERLRNSGRFHN